MQNSRKFSSGNTLLTEQAIEYNSDSSSAEFGRVITHVDTKYDGENSFTTRQSFATTVSNGLMIQNVTFTGHDDLVSTHSRTLSAFSGLLFSETDALGVTVKYTYDLLGRIVSHMMAPATDYENVTSWEYTIGDDGPVTHQTDAAGNQLKIMFDSAGREIGRQQFDPDVTKQFYDISSQSFDLLGRASTASNSDWLPDRCKSTSFSLRATVTNDDWGGVLAQSFSDNTRYFQESDPLALQKTTYMQGDAGCTTRKTGTVATSFDQKSYLALTDTLKDTSDTLQGTRLYGWDGWGQLRRETDERGNVTERTYDAFGRVLTQALPDDSVVTRTYSPHLTGEQVASISVTGPDADGNTQTWLLGTQEFDSLGRLTKQVSGGRITTYSYDGASPGPLLVTFPSGKTLQYTYLPELGNVINSVTADDVTQTFIYDKNTRRLLQEDEGKIGNEYVWNDSGTLATETFKRGAQQNVASHSSTLAGAAATYQDITGGQTVYSRDEYGRVTVLLDDGLMASFEYDELGRMSKQTVTNEEGTDSFITELEYDDFGREIKQTVTDSAGTSLITTSSWTKNGLLEWKCLTGNNYADDIQRNEMYEYDVRNRLVRYSVTGIPPVPDAYGNPLSIVIYQYDALNNLTTVISTFADGSSDTMTYQYKNSNDPTQLTSVTHSHESYPKYILLEYDADGRMTKDEAGRELSYDGLGRLSSVAGANLTGGRYHYDAGNRLVDQDTGSNGMRQLYYRGSELVVEVTSS
ncbi:RHS repeat domain-containing protein [Rahnella aceris]|uniref:RHS repeat protein n=1 Tax=Rahnella sp. (strain Y9602) TaxID=2703885 RepID=UPI0002DC75C4|nr:RHS repeat protein [Rahnella aceris]